MNNTTNQQSDKKTFWIGVLSVSAAVLMLGNYFAPRPVLATNTIKDRDFSMVTANTQNGGETLYVLDNNSHRVAIYTYDPSSRQLRTHGTGDMSNLFDKNGNGR
jgi:hypothetical protein